MAEPASCERCVPVSMVGAAGISLRQVTEDLHGCRATPAGTVPVREGWDGVVHVFALDGHPWTTRAFAWSTPIAGRAERTCFSVLALGAISLPAEAVRAAMAMA
jgi:hypothetical protein